MQIWCSSEDWTEVESFWGSVIGLHDAVLSGLEFSEASPTLILEFRDVLTHSPEAGFRIAHPSLRLQLIGVEDGDIERVRYCVGHDVIAAELLPRELWINASGGSCSVAFETMHFATP